MSQSLSFTDKQLALLLNALQFGIVATGRCEQTKDATEYAKQLEIGFKCLRTVDNETISSTHAMLYAAAMRFTDSSLYSIDPSNGKVKSVSMQTYEEHADEMAKYYADYLAQHGYRHEHDPLAQDENDMPNNWD